MLLEMNVKLRRGHFDLAKQLSISDSNVGLFGKSGAGKSTVLGLIAGTYNRTLKRRRIFKLDYLIRHLELEPILDHSVKLLSIGERQRVVGLLATKIATAVAVGRNVC